MQRCFVLNYTVRHVKCGKGRLKVNPTRYFFSPINTLPLAAISGILPHFQLHGCHIFVLFNLQYLENAVFPQVREAVFNLFHFTAH